MRQITAALCTILLFLLFIFYASPVFSQDFGTITGRVIDKETQKPLIGVNIVVSNTVLGAATGLNGDFIVEHIPEGTYSLEVSMIGYKTETEENVTVLSGQKIHLEIFLQETAVLANPIIVTAGKHPQALSSSHQAVEVVNYTRIAQRQSRKLAESLFTISGVHFNEENISIRGSSGYSIYNVGSRVLLMVDGVPVLTSDLGSINWKLLPILDVDRIEVVKGAGSALYGSAAMGGVVNIITSTPSPRGHFQMRTIAGLYDDPHYEVWEWTDKRLHYEGTDMAYSRQVGPLGFRLSFSRFVSTGYMENNDVDLWNVAGRFVYDFPNRSRLELYTGWMQSREGGFIQWLNQNSPFEVPPFNKEDELHYRITNFYTQYHVPFSAEFGLKLRISHLNTKMGTQLTAYDPGAFKPGQGFGWEIQGDWIPGNLHHITFGNEFRWDMSGSEYFGDHKGYTVSPYIQDEWTVLSNFSVTLGMRLDRHVLIDEETDMRLSPKLGLNYKPFSQTVLRGTLGSGFRAASVFEKYIEADYSGFNIIPNPDLRAERSWFWDAGVRQSFLNNSHVEISFFQADYWDMIEPVINILGTIQFQNYVRARILGIEFSGESWFWKRRIGLSNSFTWIEPKDIDRNEILPYRPKLVWNTTGSFRFRGLLLQVEYRYASRVDEVELNPMDPRVPLKLLHFRAQFKWKYFTLQLAANNALNYHYTQVERRMGEIRNVSIGLLVDVR